ncbi:hypothetical protein CALCODRAFT_496411 [Calocera cornea HHB12733]|uniref:Uncharacterized protein n=1 Tax=Calocera cornea HHB12733 TaxID=1353952 RepID=A0A165FW62_9BASI|nr:hypothetical protein CALCODRAFT_496411 [Calocera cornea HHB12733]
MSEADIVYAAIEAHYKAVENEKEQLEKDIEEKNIALKTIADLRDAAVNKLSVLDDEYATAEKGLQAADVARAQYFVLLNKRQPADRHIDPAVTDAFTASAKLLRGDSEKKNGLSGTAGLVTSATDEKKTSAKRKVPPESCDSTDVTAPKKLTTSKGSGQAKTKLPAARKQARKPRKAPDRDSIPIPSSDSFTGPFPTSPSITSESTVDKLEPSPSAECRAESVEL